MNFQNQVEYGQLHNFDVLGGVQAPSPLSPDVLKSHIMLRCGLLIPLYSEPETMREAVTHWFDYMAYGISKMLELAQAEYDPLENYHRTEKEKLWHHSTDQDRGTITSADSGTIEDNRTIADTGTIEDEGGSTTETTVSAYNSSDYEPDRKEEVTNGNTRTLNTERSDDNTRTFGNTNTKTLGTTKTIQDDHRNEREIYGNIGTMTTQEMFNQELDVLGRFNPYDWIVDRFEADLFLGIW